MLPRRMVFLLSLILTGSLAAQSVSPARLADLSVEHQKNPVGIGDSQPRLSWKITSDRQGEVQTAYEVRAASTAVGLTAAPDLWSSGKVASDQSVLVPWAGKSLTSRAQVFWQVRVWDKDGVASAWSEPANFELGLLNPETDWKGQWITVDLPRFDIETGPLSKAKWINAGSAANQSAGARVILNLPADAKILSASVDAAADGLINLYVNGHPIKQGPTSHTAPFHADFGPQVVPGKNIIALGAIPIRRPTGGDSRNAIAAHGVLELSNGQRVEFNTDDAWQTSIPAIVGTPGNYRLVDTWFTDPEAESMWMKSTVIGPYAATAVAASADSTIGAGHYLRKTFTVKGPVATARLYSTAFGVYEASLNGQRVNDHQLDPGFTDYNKRVMVQATDVAALLKPGANALGALLGDGWFAGRLGWDGLCQYKTVSDHPLFNAQLEITYTDGTKDIIATDNTWKGGAGEVIGSDDQLGEVIDARKSLLWDQATFNDSAWANATVEDHSATALVPQIGPPVRKVLELKPKKITKVGSDWMVDFGQNMVGHVRLSARGPANTVINVTHAEVLSADGSLYTENLRSAISLDTFIMKGDEALETFEPHFTFHGFRYVEISGYPGELTGDNIRGEVVGSDNPATGAWESSSADLNQLFSNIQWGQRGNYLSVPTDCPQRDERMGWMGDAQVFAPTAARNADVSGFFTKWMVDVDDAQSAAGAYNNVSPKGNQNQSYPVWGDAGVVIPWAMYNAYGDKKFLEDNYPYMARWVVYNYTRTPSLLLSGGVGDHLPPPTVGGGVRGGFGASAGGVNPTSVVDTAYFANSARIVAKAATLLGRSDDAVAYERVAREITDAFNNAYVLPDGTVQGSSQTSYILALQFNLLPENLRAAAAQKLVANIEQTQHLTTGFVGSGLLCPVLTQVGRSDVAWKLVFTDTYPSWLFTVKNGATTMWEHWDGWTPDGGFQASSMNSFNHYSFGAVGYWFYTGAAGIRLDESSPGYKHFNLAPQFTDRLTYVKSSLDSPYGKISSHWHVEGDQMVYDVTVPPNSSATLLLPVPPQNVLESGQPIAAASAATTSLPLAAGTYRFSFPKQLIK